jgi:hypothetical protein
MNRQRRHGNRSSSRRPFYTSVLGLLILCKQLNAQIGTTVCICSPAMYTMTFNFSQTCANTAITGAGVASTDCAIAPFQDDNVTNLTPVSVGSIDILELDGDLVLFTQSSRFGTFANGESFAYTSVSSDPTMVNITSYPKALQVSVIGNNAAEKTLFFAGLVIYATDCTIYPVVNVGSTLGWVKFVSLRRSKRSLPLPMSHVFASLFQDCTRRCKERGVSAGSTEFWSGTSVATR